MKSWINKALLGLCLTAPSAMALLPTIPDKYAGIYMSITGFNTTQKEAFKNGMGLWLLGMRGSSTTKLRVVSNPSAPNTVASVTIEKVNATSSKCVSGSDPRRCAFDVSYSYNGVPGNGGSIYNNVLIKVYSLTNGMPLGSSTEDQISFQNFATYLCQLVLKPNTSPATIFDLENDIAQNDGTIKQVVVPWACGIYSPGIPCTVSWGHPYYRDGLIPVLSFKRINSSGALVGRLVRKHMLDRLQTEPGPGWILTSARYLFSESPAGGKSVIAYSNPEETAGRIVVGSNSGTDAPCYTSSLGYDWDLGYAAEDIPTSGPLGEAADAGLSIQTITRTSRPYGDGFSGTYPQSCMTTIGMVGDCLQGN